MQQWAAHESEWAWQDESDLYSYYTLGCSSAEIEQMVQLKASLHAYPDTCQFIPVVLNHRFLHCKGEEAIITKMHAWQKSLRVDLPNSRETANNVIAGQVLSIVAHFYAFMFYWKYVIIVCKLF